MLRFILRRIAHRLSHVMSETEAQIDRLSDLFISYCVLVF